MDKQDSGLGSLSDNPYNAYGACAEACASDRGEVRVRFAPSPTGMLHIGGARTAVYNWAFARANGGKFILRIEDTDPERSTQENTQIILRALRWLGLDWDEGPEIGGWAGPYFQSGRGDTYAHALEALRASSAAYPCFCTQEELEAEREAAVRESGGYSGYSGKCRNLSATEAKMRIAAGQSHVWRLAVPHDHGPIEFDDAVYGHMVFPADVMDDMILVRSDGNPTYNFAVVCDDANMKITHVIRGDDHLSNTPRQCLVYEALGYPIPQFAHLPMILGPDGKKLSKRTGSTNVEEYRDRGFLPDAMINYLALLGWSLDGETTIIPRDVLAREFSLGRINKKDAIFDEEKLLWMNGVYIRQLSAEEFVDVAAPWLAQAKEIGQRIAVGHRAAAVRSKRDSAEQENGAIISAAPFSQFEAKRENAPGALLSTEDAELFKAIYPLIIERLNILDEIPEKIAYFFWGGEVVLDEKSVQKVLLKKPEEARQALSICRGVLADEGIAWSAGPLQDECRARGDAAQIRPRALFQPLRVAICGNMVSPPLFESIELMERKDMLSRIDKTCERIFSGADN